MDKLNAILTVLLIILTIEVMVMAYGLKDHRLAVVQGGLTSYYEREIDVAAVTGWNSLTFTAVPAGKVLKVTAATPYASTANYQWILVNPVGGINNPVYEQDVWQPPSVIDSWGGEAWFSETETPVIWVNIDANSQIQAHLYGVYYESF